MDLFPNDRFQTRALYMSRYELRRTLGSATGCCRLSFVCFLVVALNHTQNDWHRVMSLRVKAVHVDYSTFLVARSMESIKETASHPGDELADSGAPDVTKALADVENSSDDEGNEPLHIDAHHGETSRRTIGTLQLAVMVFYSVSGGPFGIEEAVRSGGSFCFLLGMLILPLMWSVPEAAITAELASAYPEASGGVAWVEHAFGTQAGWVAGFLGWIAGGTDSSIYPILFLDYLLQVVARRDGVHPWIHYFLVASFAIVLSYINYRGLPVVGRLSLVICAISMSPFVLVILLGVWKVEPRKWFQLPEGSESAGGTNMWSAILKGVLWRPFLNSMFWNLNSFDSASSFSGEVSDPGHSIPRAMFWAVVFVVLGYFVPLLVVLGVSDAPSSAWEDGYLATAIAEISGQWLGDWTVCAAGISNVALFQAELSCNAFQAMGMADRGYLPKIMSTRSPYGTPTYGILAGLVVVLLMSVSDLSEIIEMLNFNYAISLLMEYAAFLKLRISKPDVPRPYRIPLSTFGCFVMMLPTFCVTLLVMGLASFYTLLFSALSVVVALTIFHLRQRGCSRSRYSSVPEQTSDIEVVGLSA